MNLINKINTILSLILAGIVAIFGARLWGRKEGAERFEKKINQEILEKLKRRKDRENKIDYSDDVANLQRLQDEYSDR